MTRADRIVRDAAVIFVSGGCGVAAWDLATGNIGTSDRVVGAICSFAVGVVVLLARLAGGREARQRDALRATTPSVPPCVDCGRPFTSRAAALECCNPYHHSLSGVK
jgi:hypothetical protein